MKSSLYVSLFKIMFDTLQASYKTGQTGISLTRKTKYVKTADDHTR